MKEWYYSGLQGLCVSLSRHSSAFDGSASASALLARELFNDDSRFDSASNVSRTWRLSPARRARMFEERWTSRGRSVRASDDVRAVLACVARLRASEESFLLREALCDAANAASIVKDEILVAMESGFTTERYPDYAIRAFSDDVRSLIAAFDCFDEDAAGTLLVRLVSAAVYGPLHTLALSSGRARTDLAIGVQESSGDVFESQGIVLMQVEGPSVARVREWAAMLRCSSVAPLAWSATKRRRPICPMCSVAKSGRFFILRNRFVACRLAMACWLRRADAGCITTSGPRTEPWRAAKGRWSMRVLRLRSSRAISYGWAHRLRRRKTSWNRGVVRC